jgi:hypothetical protein
MPRRLDIEVYRFFLFHVFAGENEDKIKNVMHAY